MITITVSYMLGKQPMYTHLSSSSSFFIRKKINTNYKEKYYKEK